MTPRRILVVDDEPIIRETLAELLAEAGHDVTAAADGAAALARLEAGLEPDVVLLDLMMPVMNGWELRRRMLADPRLAAIPVIIFSGAPDGRREADQLRVAAFAAKPVRTRDLLALIERVTTAPVVA
jgi:CheY-like chemotaxis protein